VNAIFRICLSITYGGRFAQVDAVLLLALTFASSAGSALAEKRVALVIGNGAYQSVAAVPNPPRDAEAMSRLFRAAGFDEVRVETNLGVAAMRRTLRAFADRAADADIAVVFFAGHGVEIAGRNYLVPVDAALKTDIDVEDEAVDIDRVLQLLDPVTRLKLVILDACRENPFAARMRMTSASRSVGRGLAPPEPQTGNTLVAYAARAGAVAADGDGRNSPFTTALLNNLTKPGLDVRIALGQAHDEVLRITGGKQEPYIYGALGGGTLALAPVGAVTAPVLPPVANTLQVDFDAAMAAGTVVALDAFLDKYPSGPLANTARRERERLNSRQSQQQQVAVGAPTTPTYQKKAPAEGVLTDDLLARNALPDMVEGRADAPVTVIEYASMTCRQCAAFHEHDYPVLKKNYIETGKVKFILREFPLDHLSTAAFMLARASGDKRDAVIRRLFAEQRNWAFADKPLDALSRVLKQIGFRSEVLQATLKDQSLFDNVTKVRDRASQQFGVTTAPTFFVNGVKYSGRISLHDLDKIIAMQGE